MPEKNMGAEAGRENAGGGFLCRQRLEHRMIYLKKEKTLEIVCLGVGAVLATISILLLSGEEAPDNCLLNRDLLIQIPYMKILKKQLFLRILVKRAKWLFLFLVFSFSMLKNRIFPLFWGFLGYAMGALLTLSLLQYGWNGIWISMAALMPQIFFLLPAYVGLIRLFCMGTDQHAILLKGIKYSALFLAGVFMESYVNLWLMNLVGKII